MHKRKNRILIDARIKSGLTQEDMSELLNISPSSYSRYETCRIYPPLEIQENIISHFLHNGINLSKETMFSEELYGSEQNSEGINSQENNHVLFYLRKRLGFSQGKLSRQLDINAAMYSNYETLRVYPSAEVQNKFISYFASKKFNIIREYLFPKELYKSDDEINKKSNEILTSAREGLDLSRKEIAEQIGINFRTYAQYENLRLHPSKFVQNKISAYFMKNGVLLSKDDLFPDALYAALKTKKEKHI